MSFRLARSPITHNGWSYVYIFRGQTPSTNLIVWRQEFPSPSWPGTTELSETTQKPGPPPSHNIMQNSKQHPSSVYATSFRAGDWLSTHWDWSIKAGMILSGVLVAQQTRFTAAVSWLTTRSNKLGTKDQSHLDPIPPPLLLWNQEDFNFKLTANSKVLLLANDLKQ